MHEINPTISVSGPMLISYLEMGNNLNPARMNRTRTQVLPRTDPNPNRTLTELKPHRNRVL